MRRNADFSKQFPWRAKRAGTGDLFLRDLWYMPALASSLAPGQMRREMLLGEPVVLGRLKDGALFALRDICPHRGVPLSAGRIMADGSVECPYHGWRFKRGRRVQQDSLAGRATKTSKPKDQGARLSGARTGRADLGLYGGQARQRTQERAAAPGRCPRRIALDRDPDVPLRHRPCRDRADGPGARALCPCPLVVEEDAAGEGKALRAAAQRLCDDGAQAVQAGL